MLAELSMFPLPRILTTILSFFADCRDNQGRFVAQSSHFFQQCDFFSSVSFPHVLLTPTLFFFIVVKFMYCFPDHLVLPNESVQEADEDDSDGEEDEIEVKKITLFNRLLFGRA